ncbi:MAG: Ig-like domain-containing protein [Caldilineaceae bacterium]
MIIHVLCLAFIYLFSSFVAFSIPLYAQDVAIDKVVVSAVGGDANALPSENLTYILSLSGIHAATNVIVTDTLPSGITITLPPTANGIIITQTSGAPNYVWQVSGNDPAGGQIMLFAKVERNVAVGTHLINRAGISAVHDTTPADNLASATITLLNAAPVADDESVILAEDSSPTLLDVLNGDTDNNGDLLSIVAVSTPNQGGTVTISGTQLSYTPPVNFFGTESFTYTVSDGHGGSDVGQVMVNVTSVNDPPQAIDDHATVNEDSQDNLLTILNNDSFAPDTNETLSVSAVGVPNQGGSATIEGTTEIRYTPAPDFFGTEIFTYTVGDSNGGTASAKIKVTVLNLNDPPVAADDTVSYQEDSSNNPILVLANDSDLENDPLTITSVGSVNHGTITNLGEQLHYTPKANFFGTDNVTYTVSDGNGGSTSAVVTITVVNVNDAPAAWDDKVTVDEDSLNNALPVLSNDSDLEDDSLTITQVGIPAHGTVTNAGNLLRYTPAANFAGGETFTYTISDGNGGSASAAIAITVNNRNDPPLAKADALTLTTTPNDHTPTIIDVLANDSFLPDLGETLFISELGTPNHGGHAAINGGTSISYTPALNFSGVETFTYTIADGNGGSASAFIVVTLFADSDSDGIPNTVECNTTLTNCPDHDGDGIPAYLDPADSGPASGDSDHDGITDLVECPGGIPCLDTDQDGTPNYMDSDDDGDGKTTSNEDKNSDGDQNPSTQPLDIDQDGIADYLDADTNGPGSGDSDGDRIQDSVECPTQPCPDRNADQTPDYMDTDADGDGIADRTEGAGDSDLDRTPNFLDDDDDGDGLSTQSECPIGSPCPDGDGDGIPDSLESNTADPDHDTIPNDHDKDSDGDGLTDRYEGLQDRDSNGIADFLDLDSDGDGLYDLVEAGHDDLDSNHDGLLDNQTDSDHDGLPDSIDPSIGGTPLTIQDSDLDGIPDHQENRLLDSDGDGSNDQEDNDDDGDGSTTYSECPNGLPASTPCPDSDEDGIPNYLESAILDSDNDSLPNSQDSDADNDGLPDMLERGQDEDGDAVPNYLDLDSDGDGIKDIQEAGYKVLDNNQDGRIDNTIDTDGDGLANVVDGDNGGIVLTPPDADHDGIADFLESNKRDSDQDGLMNALDADDDGDDLLTRQECATGVPCKDGDSDHIPDYLDKADQGPKSGDSDGDSVEDATECPTSWPCLDTDGDGLPNYLDPDDDDDGLPTIGSRDFTDEGLSDLDQDGIPNYLDPASNGPTSGDSDGDGLSDHEECPTGSPCPDSNKDGMPDYMDSNGAVKQLFLPMVTR